METAIVIRNGEIAIRLPLAEAADGKLNNKGNLLFNIDKMKVAGIIKSQAVEMAKSGKVSQELRDCAMHIGDNGCGCIVMWAKDYNAQQTAKHQAEWDAKPAEERAMIEERRAIDKLFAAAYQSKHNDTDDNQMMRAMHQKCEAKSRLDAWKAKYTQAANEEKAENLQARAEKQRELASGAMLYNADGWINSQEQEKRRDAFLTQANKLEAEASELLKN